MNDKALKEAEDLLTEPNEIPALANATPREVRKGTRTAAKHEPQMRALRRILGDSVLDVFPLGVIQAVDKSYEFWMTHPDSFLDTPFDTVQAKDDALTVMRAYAECAGEKGYTIRTDPTDDPLVLSWRAQNRRGTKDD